MGDHMKKLSVKKLKSGMIAATNIVTKRGQIIAESGTILSNQLIARLSFYRIEEVMVEDEILEEVSISSDSSNASNKATDEKIAAPSPIKKKPHPEISKELEKQSYTSKITHHSNFQDFQLSYTRNLENLRGNIQDIITGDLSQISEEELLKETCKLFQSKTALDLFDMLRNMRALDDSVYAHSLNVALISRAIGKWLKLSKEDLDLLTLAGLLHDIGKTQIPEEILNKTSKLTDDEFNLIRQHTILGFKLLKKIPNLDSRIQYTALQHHERYDGSGYPRGLGSDEIEDFASIVAIADVFDAMTAARTYRAAKCAFQVIEAFEKDGLQKYNPQYILTFLEHIASFYQNSRVMLNDGTSARIIYINKNSLSHPVIQLDSGEMCDLSHSNAYQITSIM